MSTKLKPLSTYEETCIWMSYRYAIGRHTIAACMHAHDILKHSYERLKLTPNKMKQMFEDINVCLSDNLRFSYDIYVDTHGNKECHVFDELFNFIVDKDTNELNITSFKNDNKIHIDIYDINDKTFNREPLTNKYNKEFLLMELEDLIVWANTAKVLDMSSHYNAKLINDTIVECVDIIDIYCNDGCYFMKYVTVPIKEYCENPHRFIPNENIKERIYDNN